MKINNNLGKSIFVSFVLSVLVLCSLLVSSAVDSEQTYVDSKVISEFDDESEVRVLVKLKDDSTDAAEEFVSDLAFDVEAKSSNSDLLGILGVEEKNSNLDEGDVDVEKVFEESSAVVLTIHEEEALDLLMEDSDVEGIYYDYPVQAFLDTSVAQINGDDVWGLDLGFDLTGVGRSVCVIDTGIDYTHSSLDGCSPVNYTTSGDIETLSTAVESDHDYSNSEDVTYTINMSGYSNIAIHFSNISLETLDAGDATDRIYVYNEDNETVAVYKGVQSDIWTPSSNGSIMYVRLVTDGSVVDYGFVVDKAINGTTNTTVNWTDCPRIAGGYDLYNDDSDPYDDHGHGTHVAGIVGSNSTTYMGVAPNSSLVAVKVLDSSGSGYSSDIAAGVDYCVNNQDKFGIDVISMSLGGSTEYDSECSSDLIAPSIKRAYDAGIAVVVATGNDGASDGVAAPACAPYAIPVGSTDSDSTISSFSNVGNLLSLLAPGSSITSTFATVDGAGFGALSGTSMATPHVSGAFLLFQQYAREVHGAAFDPLAVEKRFNSSGTFVNDTANSGNNFNEIDVLAALKPQITFGDLVVNDSSSQVEHYVFVNVSSDVNLSMALLEWDHSNGTFENITMTQENETQFVYNMTGLKSGLDYFAVYGNDSYLMGETELRDVTIISDLKAALNNPLNNSVHASGFYVNLSFLSNQTNLSYANVSIFNSSSNEVVLVGGSADSIWAASYNFSFLFNITNSSFAHGNYTLLYFANNSEGEEFLENTSLYIDLVDPSLSTVSSSDVHVNVSDTVLFQVNVTDDFVNESYVYFESNFTGSFVNYSMTTTDNYTYNYSLDGLGNLSGSEKVGYSINAYDKAGNGVVSSSATFTVQNNAVDYVNITSHDNGTQIELGALVNYTVDATDNDSDSFTYEWNFSDGDSNVNYSDQNVSYAFSNMGENTIFVRADDANSTLMYNITVYVNDTVGPNISSLTVSNISTSSGVAEAQTVRATGADLNNVSSINLYYDGDLVNSSELTNSSGNWTFGSFSSTESDVSFIIEVVDNSTNYNKRNHTFTFDVTASGSGSSGGGDSGGSSGGSSGGGGGGSSSSSSSSSTEISEEEASSEESGSEDSTEFGETDGSEEEVEEDNAEAEEEVKDECGDSFLSKALCWIKSVVNTVTGAVTGTGNAVFVDAEGSVDSEETGEVMSVPESEDNSGPGIKFVGMLFLGVLGLFGVYALVRPKGGY